MGRDKATLPFGPGTLLSAVVSSLAPAVDEIAIVLRPGQEPPDPGPLPRGVTLRFAVDDVEGRGPVAGLAAGLRVLASPVAFASSCDVPFLSPAFVERVLDRLGDADVAIPVTDGRPHPLAAAYRRATVLPRLEALLAAGRLRPVFLLESSTYVSLSEDGLREVDPSLGSLRNLNTPDDYDAARREVADR
jgi:molybdopterin-guanine dinucleotide biosynthesis protein A